MGVGTAKWFNGQKGFSQTDGGRDVIVHLSAIARAEPPILTEWRSATIVRLGH